MSGFPRILKRLKKNVSNNKQIYGFDVETEQVDRGKYTEQKFLMGSIVGDDITEVFWDRNDMIDTMMTKRKFRGCIFMATNLDFDYTHIFQKTGKNKDVKKLYRNGTMIHGSFRQKERYEKTEFLDTWNYTGKMSLKKMGDMLNIPKLDPPSCFKRRPETLSEKREMRDYNMRDSLITQKFGVKLQDFFTCMGCKMKMTIASTGLDYWRRNHQPVDLFQEREEWLRKHYEGSFRGGRVEVFKRGLVENAFYYDYNSHYPARCYEGFDGKGSYPQPSTSHYDSRGSAELIETYEGISKVRIKAPEMYMPLLGITSVDGKYIFPEGVLEGWYTHVELRKALDNGYELLSVGETIYYTETFKPFRETIRTLYPLKKKFKEEGERVMTQMVKTMMNAGVFGKFCQKLEGFEDVIDIDNTHVNDDGVLCRLVKGELMPLGEHVIRNELVFAKSERKSIPIFTFPVLSSYTTALGRVKLWDDFSPYHEDLVYCDTDSGVLLKKRFGSSGDLGELDMEHVIRKGLFVRPKFYYMMDRDGSEHFKSKGVGKYISSRSDFDDVMRTSEVVTERFTKVKESGVMGVPYSSIVKVNKVLNLEDDKRVWKDGFDVFSMQDSTPHSFRDGMTGSERSKALRKALEMEKSLREAENRSFINSDLFDSHAVGCDISKEEFLENEKWFAKNT